MHFTKHARIRLSERSVTEEQVREAIESPDELVESFGARFVATKNLSDGILRVVFRRANAIHFVITVYWIGEKV